MATSIPSGANIQMDTLSDVKSDADCMKMHDRRICASDVGAQWQRAYTDEQIFADSANSDLDNVRVTITTEANNWFVDSYRDENLVVTSDPAQRAAEPSRDVNAIPTAAAMPSAAADSYHRYANPVFEPDTYQHDYPAYAPDSHQHDNPAYWSELSPRSPETAADAVIERPSEQHVASARDVHVEAAVMTMGHQPTSAASTSNHHEPSRVSQHANTADSVDLAYKPTSHKVKTWYRRLLVAGVMGASHANNSRTNLQSHEDAMTSDSHLYETLEAAGPDLHDTEQLQRLDSAPPLTTADFSTGREPQLLAGEVQQLGGRLQTIGNDMTLTLPPVKVDNATNTELLDEQLPQVSLWSFPVLPS